METLAIALKFNSDPYDVEAGINALPGNLVPGSEDYEVTKVLSISVTWTGTYFAAFLLAEVTPAE